MSDADKDKKDGSMRPTIIIGMGGTGDQIVTRVKARFLETHKSKPELLRQVRWLVFDTDPNHKPVRNSAGEEVYLERGVELIDIGGVNVGAVQDNISRYPEIAAELPAVRDLRRVVIQQGAKQERPIGRLCFLYHFERVRQAIYNALDSVLNIAAHLDEPGARSAINVFIISSTCGGTGSSSIIDIAYLVRYLAGQRGMTPDSIFNTGMLVLPEAFYNQVAYSSRDRIRANTSAMLTELDHFTVQGGFSAEYIGRHKISDNAPPFNITYLVDATNENSKGASSMGQLGPLLAEAIFLQAGSYEGRQTSSSFDNVPGSISFDRHGFLRAYSIVGTASLRFDALRMRQACVYKLVQQLVDGVFLQKPDLEARSETFHEENQPAQRFLTGVKANVSQYRAELGLTEDLILAKLKEKKDGRFAKVELDIVGLAERPLNQIISLVQNELANAQIRANEHLSMARLKRTGAVQRLEGEPLGLETEAKALLNDFVYRICDDLELGVHGALRFLEELDRELKEFGQRLSEIRQQAQAKAGTLTKELDKEEEKLNKSLKKFSLFGLYRGYIRNALAHHEAFQRRRIESTFTQGLSGEAITLLAAIETRRQQLIGVLQNMQGAFTEAGSSAQRELSSLKANWTPGYVTEINYDRPEDIDEFYNARVVENLAQEARVLIGEKNERAPSRWLKKFEEPRAQSMRLANEIKKWLIEYAESKFASLEKEITLEELIQKDRPNPNLELDRVIALAAPFANHDLASIGQAENTLNEISIIGVADSAKSIFRDRAGKATLVSTFDPHRISVLVTKHGLSVYSLRQYPLYRRHFFDYVAESEDSQLTHNETKPVSLICYNSVESEMKGRRLFIQALALGLIKVKGAVGYVLKDDEKEYRLGRELLKAMQSVVGNQQIQNAIETLFDEKRRSVKNDAELIELYDRYLNQPPPAKAPQALYAELCMIISSERDRLR